MINEVDLHAEVRKGEKAWTAYDSYVRAHIEAVRQQISKAFFDCQGDLATLGELKSLADAIQGLETSILSDIETGTMARKQLEKENG